MWREFKMFMVAMPMILILSVLTVHPACSRAFKPLIPVPTTTVANLLPAHSETTISTVSVRQVYHRTASNPWQVSFLLCVRTVNILK